LQTDLLPDMSFMVVDQSIVS